MVIAGLGSKHTSTYDMSFAERNFRVDFIWLKPTLRKVDGSFYSFFCFRMDLLS